jgi:hypothetical protein
MQTNQQELDAARKEWRDALDNSFFFYRAQRDWTAAEIGLETSRKLLEKGEFEEALDEVEHARQALARVGKFLASQADDEAGMLAVWQRWAGETVEDSRLKGGCAIVVDKAQHHLQLYQNGALIQTYDCNLGYNSGHQKMFAGDGATPEGKYTVTKVKQISKFYKALLLDYPNPSDAGRFKENKRRGLVSARAGIGRLIEIHGGGGQGKDWTDGCVALADDDLDRLLKSAGVGTPVTIVRRANGRR